MLAWQWIFRLATLMGFAVRMKSMAVGILSIDD
jgi:hypothetical protein